MQLIACGQRKPILSICFFISTCNCGQSISFQNTTSLVYSNKLNKHTFK